MRQWGRSTISTINHPLIKIYPKEQFHILKILNFDSTTSPDRARACVILNHVCLSVVLFIMDKRVFFYGRQIVLCEKMSFLFWKMKQNTKTFQNHHLNNHNISGLVLWICAPSRTTCVRRETFLPASAPALRPPNHTTFLPMTKPGLKLLFLWSLEVVWT